MEVAVSSQQPALAAVDAAATTSSTALTFSSSLLQNERPPLRCKRLWRRRSFVVFLVIVVASLIFVQIVVSTNASLPLSSLSSVAENKREIWATIPSTRTATITSTSTNTPTPGTHKQQQQQQQSRKEFRNGNTTTITSTAATTISSSFLVPLPSTYNSTYKKSTYTTTWNDNGCMDLVDHDRNDALSTVESRNNVSSAPTGMVVTLAKQDKDGAAGYLKLLCNKVPTQQAYFLEPHGMDMLLLLDIYGVDYHQVADCLELVEETSASTSTTSTTTNKNNHQRWMNLDGTALATYAYTSETGRGTVYLAPYDNMPFPTYIQRNTSILKEKMWNNCPAPPDYIQGCRYYSDQFLHLGILQHYDYMIKLDLDVEFKEPSPFNLLWDMKQRGAVFGHTGEFPDGLKACTNGIKDVVTSFVREYSSSGRRRIKADASSSSPSSWARHWKGQPCSAGIPDFERGYDQYYTNLVIMNRAFFQSEPVRAYGRWMNEYDPGFFRYKWTDQLFFHIAMGLFLGPNFRNYVMDYTHLRCRRYPKCWFFWAGDGVNARNFCRAPGGIFYHGKNMNRFGTFSWDKVRSTTAIGKHDNRSSTSSRGMVIREGTGGHLVSPMMDVATLNANFNNNTKSVNWYQHDCGNLEEQEHDLLATLYPDYVAKKESREKRRAAAKKKKKKK